MLRMERNIMKNAFKYTAGACGIILCVLSLYFGAYLPLQKARRYIEALQGARSVQSAPAFKENFRRVLDFNAPISDDEIVKFIQGDIITLVSKGIQPEEVSMDLVTFIEGYSDQEDVLHLVNLARLHHFLWLQFRKDGYFEKSEAYYKKVLDIAPKLPPALYGMLDLYRVKEDGKKILEFSDKTLRYWPNDVRVIELKKIYDDEKGV